MNGPTPKQPKDYTKIIAQNKSLILLVMGVPENMASMDFKNARYINSSWISQQTELMHTATMHMTNVSSAIIDVFDRAMLPAFVVDPTLLGFGNNNTGNRNDDDDSDSDSDDGNLRVSPNKRKHTNNTDTKSTQNKQPRQSSTQTSVNKNWYLFIYLFIYLFLSCIKH